jgi:hypothetical protein
MFARVAVKLDDASMRLVPPVVALVGATPAAVATPPPSAAVLAAAKRALAAVHPRAAVASGSDSVASTLFLGHKPPRRQQGPTGWKLCDVTKFKER